MDKPTKGERKQHRSNVLKANRERTTPEYLKHAIAKHGVCTPLCPPHYKRKPIVDYSDFPDEEDLL